MGFKIEGKLVDMQPTVQVNERFRKREFVLEVTEEYSGGEYTNYVKFQAAQSRCDSLDRWTVGDCLLVHFNVKGNRWEKEGKVNYITNLDAWKTEAGTQRFEPHSSPTQEHEAKQLQAKFDALTPQQKQAAISAATSNNGGALRDGGAGYYQPAPEGIDDLPF